MIGDAQYAMVEKLGLAGLKNIRFETMHSEAPRKKFVREFAKFLNEDRGFAGHTGICR
jgi:hypothetical protein